MRPVRKITAEMENFRMEPMAGMPGCDVIRRDPVEPEPVGTIVLMPFRVTGYDKDCDGSLMARLDGIDPDGNETGWDVRAVGIEGSLVVTADELKSLFA